MNNWKQFNSKDISKLTNCEVKTNDGKVHTVWHIVGTAILKKDETKINPSSILFWREKQNLERFKTLQKHNALLESLDLDDIETVISSSLGYIYGSEKEQELSKFFNEFKEYVEAAQTKIIRESKTYLQ